MPTLQEELLAALKSTKPRAVTSLWSRDEDPRLSRMWQYVRMLVA